MRVPNSGMKKGFKYAEPKQWYNNGIVETQIFKSNTIPAGYVRGRLLKNCLAWNTGKTKENDLSVKKISEANRAREAKNLALHGKKIWINNNVIECCIREADSIPNGFVKGRLPRLKSETPRKTRIVRKASVLCEDIDFKNKFLSMWSTSGVSEIKKQLKLLPEELQDLTNFLGLEPPKEHTRYIRHVRLLGKNTWSKGRTASPATRQHMSEAQRAITDAERQLMKQKEHTTKKQNGSYLKHETKAEATARKILLKYFTEADIEFQYLDKERYPFVCDFYIKSRDLFIEINAYPSHGKYPYRGIEEDLTIVKEWQAKAATGKKQYYNWIYTWTKLDVKKLSTAADNKLKIIFNYDLNKLEEALGDYL